MNTKTLLSALACVLAGSALAAPQISKERIDSMAAVMLQQAEQQARMQGGRPAQTDGAEIRKQAERRLQITEVLKQEAFKAGLDKDAEVQNRLKNMEADFYADAYALHLEKTVQADESDVRKLYDLVSRTVKIQQIAFNSADEAKAAQALLLKGLSFEELVKRHPGQGMGTDNFIHPRELGPEIGRAVASMNRGEVSKEPLPYNGKFYLIKLAAEGRNPEIPPFAQIKDQLLEQAKQQKVQEQIAQILKNNGINP
ncbi:MAG: peptidyl-prolyl cis-trans isomerase [Neisseria sp.]|uniref:peptidylprolyl isomerase n=1 Tax=Neisseria sp. TaxID=192066 RepID=UPI0026DCE5D4|nr:peptidylprolyl isomerase [Neisseria sp.]MDO4249494.1 peptidyl-prolyl cis-trans isomerase [Neisseria sp.]